MSVLDLLEILSIPAIIIKKNSRSVHPNSLFRKIIHGGGEGTRSMDLPEGKIYMSRGEELSLAEVSERAKEQQSIRISLKAPRTAGFRVRKIAVRSESEGDLQVLLFEPESVLQAATLRNLNDTHLDENAEKDFADLQKEISEKTYELSILYEFSREMNSFQNLEDFSRFILEAVNRMSSSECSLMLVQLDHAPVIFFSLSRFMNEMQLEKLKEAALMLSGGTSKGTAQEAQITVYRSTDYISEGFFTVPDISQWMPLFRKGIQVGMIGICMTDKGKINESRIRLLHTISNQASAALDRFLSTQETEQSRFRSIVHSMTEGVVLTDLRGHTLMANPAADRIISNLNLSREEGFFESLGSKEFIAGISRIKRGKEASVSGDITFSRHQTILNVTASSVVDAKDKITGIVFVFSDITKQRQLQEQIIQTEKLTALGELISGVAHELNNPLATVIGYAQLLQIADAPADIKKKLNIVNSESKRCQRIVQDLLTFARKHKYERKRIDVNSAIDSVLQLLAYQLKVNGIELIKDYSKEPPLVLADFHQVQQVFLNLLHNALQALREVKRKRTISIMTEISEKNVRVEVKDNGTGIKEENIGKVFDPFFTTKEPGSGTGLGLSIARGTVREHGGDIEVLSVDGEGTSFVVRLPFAGAAKTKERDSARSDTAVIVSKKRKILVVDDEEDIYHLIEEALRSDEHIIGYACDGQEALRELKESAFDLIISDYKMPHMDGKQFFTQVNKKYPHLKDRFIFITGDTADSATDEFIRKRRARFLTKPFDIEEIKRAVRETFSKS